jgi:hypothetical protein
MNPLYKQQYDDGKVSEDRFCRIISSYGKKISEATKKQNIEDHIDFFIGGSDDSVVSVDVKGPKGKDRNDPNKRVKPINESWTWVEYKNVIGNPGWLYGKADYIAFEVLEGFLVVKRLNLLSYCDSVIDKSNHVVNSWDAKYKIYTRTKYDKFDEISYIDVSKIPNSILLNDKDYNP